MGLLVVLALLPVGPPDPFPICSALQGLYDELSATENVRATIEVNFRLL